MDFIHKIVTHKQVGLYRKQWVGFIFFPVQSVAHGNSIDFEWRDDLVVVQLFVLTLALRVCV